jgi:hypothetical protein
VVSDGTMAIKAGDLVMVVKPTICCGRAVFGKPFTAGLIRMSTDPSWCGWCSTANAATMITELPDGTVMKTTHTQGPELTPKQSYRKAAFNAATAGMHAWTIAKAFNRMRPGMDFRGCTKTRLREVFVSGELAERSASELRRFLAPDDKVQHHSECGLSRPYGEPCTCERDPQLDHD